MYYIYMYFSHYRLDGPLSLYEKIEPVLKKYCSGYVVGHEKSKRSKKLHFHIHCEHTCHIDTLRKKFRKVLPLGKMALSKMRTFVAKNIAYCIKNLLHCFHGIDPEPLEEAKRIVKTFKKQKGWRLTKKCRVYVEESLQKLYLDVKVPDPNKYLDKIKDKRHIIKLALNFFTEQGLSYPLRSWMNKMYIELLIENDCMEMAIDYYE